MPGTAALPAAFAISVNGLTQFLVALFSLFFLLRDSEYFVHALRSFIPLSDGDAADVLLRVQQTVGRPCVAASWLWKGALAAFTLQRDRIQTPQRCWRMDVLAMLTGSGGWRQMVLVSS